MGEARQIRICRWLLMDALRHASGVAARLSEATEGTDAMMLFEDARKAIEAFAQEHPAMVALSNAAVEPRDGR